MAEPGRRGDDLALAGSARSDRRTPEGAPDDDAQDLLKGALPTGGARGLTRRRATGAARILAGRGWTVTAVAADTIMLVLAVVAALIGAHAAHVNAAAPELAWAFPPLVVALLAIRGLYRPKIAVQFLDEVGHV